MSNENPNPEAEANSNLNLNPTNIQYSEHYPDPNGPFPGLAKNDSYYIRLIFGLVLLTGFLIFFSALFGIFGFLLGAIMFVAGIVGWINSGDKLKGEFAHLWRIGEHPHQLECEAQGAIIRNKHKGPVTVKPSVVESSAVYAHLDGVHDKIAKLEKKLAKLESESRTTSSNETKNNKN